MFAPLEMGRQSDYSSDSYYWESSTVPYSEEFPTDPRWECRSASPTADMLVAASEPPRVEPMAGELARAMDVARAAEKAPRPVDYWDSATVDSMACMVVARARRWENRLAVSKGFSTVCKMATPRDNATVGS